MHRLLKRQLKKSKITDVNVPTEQQWIALITRIDQSYEDTDQDRYTLERSLEISSIEMQELYQKQKTSFDCQQAILNALPDLLYLLDENGVYLEVSSQINDDLLDLPQKELLGKSLHQVLPQQLADEFLKNIKIAISSNELQIMNYQLELKNRVTYLEGRISVTEQSVKNKKTVILLTRDVTVLVEAEQHKNLLNMAMNSSSEGLVVINRDKKVIYANEALARMTGLSIDALLKEGEGFLRHEKDQDLFQSICHDAHKNTHVQREIVVHKGETGQTSVLLNLSTFRNEDEKIEYFVGVLTDITELKVSKNRLKYIATHDALTGIPNRLLFDDRFQQSIANAQRLKNNGALLFLDIDGFKNINDTLGHNAGDDVLIEMAKRLQSICRANDTVARFGGDEFVLIIDNVESRQSVYLFVEKLLRRFSDKMRIQGYELKITTSIGITLFPEQGINTEQLIRQADTAMYAAKNNGKNGYHLFVESLLAVKMAEFNLDIELNKALENDEFYLLYQPQFSLETNSITGFEALIRWQHPIKGLVLPGEFIPAAEASGLIEQVGMWVFVKTCEQVVRWSKLGLDFKRMSFNVSQRQLINPNFADNLLNILHYTGAGKYVRLLECEITESAIFNEGENAHKNLYKLSQSGMLLAIDDFGTGHSSLVNLKRFPFNRLKIDKSFVTDVGKDTNDEAIIKATIALADSFNLDVIAEGVETKEQENFLMSVGCEEVQGYYYSQALSEEAAELLIRNVKSLG